MNDIIIEAQPEAPYYPIVSCISEEGQCTIEGESYMEEAYKFYMPILDWIKDYTQSKQKPLTINFKLTYFNTSSSRLILDLLDLLAHAIKSGCKVSVNWYYDTEDPDMKDEIEDFEIESGVKINMTPME